jgi:hypothetical protein
MNTQQKYISSYHEAWDWISQNSGTGSANGLAKLVLSLWNQEHSYSYRECITSMDEVRIEIALRMILEFSKTGENLQLREIGHKVYKSYPYLAELTEAMIETRRSFEKGNN